MVYTSRIFRFALEIAFLLSKYIFLQMAYALLSQRGKLNERGDPNKRGGDLEKFLKKNNEGGGNRE